MAQTDINNYVIYKRASQDFLGCSFQTRKCPTCKSEYERMEIDNLGTKCPKCDNKWSEDY